MVYSYYMNDAGEWCKSKNFDSWKEFKDYAIKHPKVCFVGSTTEPDFLGRAYSGHPDFNRI